MKVCVPIKTGLQMQEINTELIGDRDKIIKDFNTLLQKLVEKNRQNIRKDVENLNTIKQIELIDIYKISQ